MMTAQRALVLSIIMLVLLTALAGCIAPPKGNPKMTSTPPPGMGSGSQVSVTPVTPTTVPVVTGFVTQVTPFSVPTTPRPPTKYTVFPNIQADTTNYVAIYYNVIAFKSNKTAISYNLTMPPMVIQMCFKPNLTTRTIWYESRYGEKENITETVTSIGPEVWFEVVARDPITGDILAKEGYSRRYSTDTAKSMTIRTPGTYLIEFAGNAVKVDIQILVPNTIEQQGVTVRNLSCSGQLPQ